MKTTRGFTLVEVLLVLFVVSIGVGGVFAFISSSTKTASLVTNQLVASYLAQEGTEIVRNIRDTNFLDIASGGASGWDDGLTGCVTGCQADYLDTSLSGYTGVPLDIVGSFYVYGGGANPSIFRREITLTPGADRINVQVDVSWTERGITHHVVSETELYDWIQ